MLPERVDVAIVGGGFAGCATAWALAERGVRARVLEREPELGRHASGRGAGLGRQLAEDDPTTALTVEGARLLRERFGAVWAPTGGILSFDDPAHAAAYVARAARFDVAHEVVDRARVLAAWPQLAGVPVASALFVPGDGLIDARALLGELARGLDLARGTGVTSIVPAGRGVRLETTRGPLEARVVVDAAGGWAGALTADPPLEVFKRHLFALEVEPAAAAPFVWHLGAEELYVRSFAEGGGGTLACACDAEPTPPREQVPAEDADARLRARFGPGAPALAGAPVARRWACQRSFTPDRQMRIGRDPARPWLVWAAGLGGHGATAAAAVGVRAAAAVLDALA